MPEITASVVYFCRIKYVHAGMPCTASYKTNHKKSVFLKNYIKKKNYVPKKGQ